MTTYQESVTNNVQNNQTQHSGASQVNGGYLRTAYVESLGCAANRADRLQLIESLSEVGWTMVDEPGAARAIIVLTCGFTLQAETSGQRRIQELAGLLPEGGKLLIGGCLPAIAGKRLMLPESTLIFGPATLTSAVDSLRDLAHDVPYRPGVGTGIGLPLVYPLRVSTGCLSKCTFCAIPAAAGRTKSKTPSSILEEVKTLQDKGVQAVHLTSEDFSAYGRDIGSDYLQLLKLLLNNTAGVRFTLDTLNPRWISQNIDELVELLGDERLDKRVYVPVQSGSTNVLKKMARGYTGETIHEILPRLMAVTGLKVTSDLIVGFPGETELDFEASRELVRKYDFDFLEVFSYSARVGTPAAAFSDSIEPSVSAQRAVFLIADFLEKKLSSKGVSSLEDALQLIRTAGRLPINTNLALPAVV